MTTTYPTTKQTIPNPSSTDTLENATPELDHDYQHSTVNDTIEALQDKVGVDGSAVTTSHDYKLSEVTSTDKAVGKTATQTLTNKTLTSPTITGATLTTSTVNGVTLSSSGSSSLYLKEDGTYGSVSSADATYSSKGSVQGLTDAATSGLTISSGVISVNSGTSANNIVKLDSSAKLPAVDGSALTNLPYVGAIQSLTNSSQSSGTSTIFSYTVPILRANSYVEIELPFQLDASFNTTGGTVTMTGKYSSSTVGTAQVEKLGSIAGSYIGAGIIKYVFKNNGATNSQICSGAITNPGVPNTTGNGFALTGSNFTAGGTLTVDSTSTQTFSVESVFSAALGTVTFSKPVIKILHQN